MNSSRQEPASPASASTKELREKVAEALQAANHKAAWSPGAQPVYWLRLADAVIAAGAGQVCAECRGVGWLDNGKGGDRRCPSCDGSGMAAAGAGTGLDLNALSDLSRAIGLAEAVRDDSRIGAAAGVAEEIVELLEGLRALLAGAPPGDDG